MLAEARAKILRARFVQGDLHALPVASASTDLAVCGLALEEPLVDEAFVASIQPPGIWRALADALKGLPVAMIWTLRRR